MTKEEAIKILSNQEMIDVMWDKADDALNMAIDALEQEPCEDCISRKDAINAIKRTVSTEQIKALKRLPSVQPKPKTGHWILKKGSLNVYECSECGRTIILDRLEDFPYCHCGAKMEG